MKSHADGSITFWDDSQGGLQRAVPREDPPVTNFGTVRVHPNGATCIVSPLYGPETATAVEYDLATGAQLRVLGIKGVFSYLGDGSTGCFYPFFGESPRGVIVDLTTDIELRRLMSSAGAPSYLEASRDGDTIAVASSGSLTIYRAESGAPLLENLSIGPAQIGQPALSPDGREVIIVADSHILAPTGNLVRKFSTETGQQVRAYPHRGSFLGRATAWSADGRLIAYLHFKDEPYLFCPAVTIADARSGTLLGEIDGPSGHAVRLGFTDDSRELWIASVSGEVSHYDVTGLIGVRALRAGSNTLAVTWDEPDANASYLLEESSDLLPENWTPVTGAAQGSYDTLIAPDAPARYFRVRKTD